MEGYRYAGACRFRLSGDTGAKRYTYVVVLHEGVLSAYDCVTVNEATKPRIRDTLTVATGGKLAGRVNSANAFPGASAVLMLNDDVVGHYRWLPL